MEFIVVFSKLRQGIIVSLVLLPTTSCRTFLHVRGGTSTYANARLPRLHKMEQSCLQETKA